MMKNIAISVKTLRAGDKDSLKRQGIQQMDNHDIAAQNADELARAQYQKLHGHKESRAAEYPSVGEQLDALWKALDAIILGRAIPEDAVKIRDQIASIKKQHPKQEG